MENGEFVDAAKISANDNKDESESVAEMLESCLQIGDKVKPANEENTEGEEICCSYLEQLPSEMLAKICAQLDHDSLLAMAAQCRSIQSIALPMLHEQRKDILAVLEPQIVEAKRLFEKSEKYLKRVLRTNEDLSGIAVNLPMQRADKKLDDKMEIAGEGGTKDWMALFLMNYLTPKDDYFERERVANELAQIARLHCYDFGRYSESELAEAFNSVEITVITEQRISKNAGTSSQIYYNVRRQKRLLSGETMLKLKKRVNYLLFQDFIRKYPVLSKFTMVHWPAELAEEDREKIAMEYAEKNFIGSRKNIYKYKERFQGRMHEMNLYGIVGNPITTRTRPVRHQRHWDWEDNYDYYDYPLF